MGEETNSMETNRGMEAVIFLFCSGAAVSFVYVVLFGGSVS